MSQLSVLYPLTGLSRRVASTILFRMLALGLAALAVGCGGSSSTSSNTSSTSSPQHLYVATSQNIVQYTLPLTGNATPSATISAPGSLTVAVDSNGNLATSDIANNINVYKAPITSASTPFATFNSNSLSQPRSLAFNPAGDLFVVTDTEVLMFSHPLSSASTVAQTISFPFAGVFVNQAAADGNGNLYVSGSIAVQGVVAGRDNVIFRVVPPYTAQPGVIASQSVLDDAFGSVAVSSTEVFVANDQDFIEGFLLTGGLESSSLTVSRPNALALDNGGNLYVTTLNNQMLVFAPPFSSSSVPSLTLTGGGAAIAIGK